MLCQHQPSSFNCTYQTKDEQAGPSPYLQSTDFLGQEALDVPCDLLYQFPGHILLDFKEVSILIVDLRRKMGKKTDSQY